MDPSVNVKGEMILVILKVGSIWLLDYQKRLKRTNTGLPLRRVGWNNLWSQDMRSWWRKTREQAAALAMTDIDGQGLGWCPGPKMLGEQILWPKSKNLNPLNTDFCITDWACSHTFILLRKRNSPLKCWNEVWSGSPMRRWNVPMGLSPCSPPWAKLQGVWPFRWAPNI